jgi:tripartite-type tricarboxylate transporter receptor subunit TctC
LAPAGTPGDIVDLLNREIAKIMQIPDVKAKCVELGFDVVADSRVSFAYIKKDVEKWGKVIHDTNIPQIR